MAQAEFSHAAILADLQLQNFRCFESFAFQFKSVLISLSARMAREKLRFWKARASGGSIAIELVKRCPLFSRLYDLQLAAA